MSIQHCRDDMANVSCLFEYERSATIESQLLAMNYFHRISRGFELDTTHPVFAMPLKALIVGMPTWKTKLPCVGLFHGECCLLARLWFHLGALGVGFCCIVCLLRFAS